jgi:DNA-binding CsgD family transcriptional regulator
MVWIFVNNILVPFFRELKKGNTLKTALINTYPGNLLLAVGILAVTVIIDILDSLVLHYSIGFTRYSMLVFVLSVAFMFARLHAKTGRELAEKSALLEKANNPAAAREKIFSSCGLSEREKEIARLVIEGLDNDEIGKRLFLAASTIAFHVTNIYRKFGIIDGKNRGRAAFLVKVLSQ